MREATPEELEATPGLARALQCCEEDGEPYVLRKTTHPGYDRPVYLVWQGDTEIGDWTRVWFIREGDHRPDWSSNLKYNRHTGRQYVTLHGVGFSEPKLKRPA